MTYKLLVLKVEKVFIQANNQDMIEVEFEIQDEQGVVQETRKLGFAVGISQQEIEDELAKVVTTYRLEKEQAVKQKEVDTANAEAEKTISGLVGLEITDSAE